MRTTNVLLILVGLVVAAPLAAQGNTVITVNDTTVVTIYDNDSTFIFIEQAPRDSAAVARDEAAARAMREIADYLENCGCVSTGPTYVNVAVNAGLTLAAFLIAWQLRGIKNNGVDGTDGVDGKDGVDGVDGKDGQDHEHDDPTGEG